jgi:WD40 repeat protein
MYSSKVFMKHSRTFLLLFLTVVALAAMVSCRKDDTNPVDGGNNTPTVTTTIAGVISDESGVGMSHVIVSAHGQTAITNENGLFLLRNIRVPEDRCFVIVEKEGYFTASRAEMPQAGGVTHMRLGLMRLEAKYTLQSAAGGTVTLTEGGSVQFPANGFVTANGEAYTGTVKVAARWLNPTSSDFFQFFPGDFTARRADNSEAFLYSFGVLNVELFTPSGATLKLAPGKKAVLQYPIPAQLQASAPSSMPLWYFDETIGMWKEEGNAIKQGSTFVGEVSHFTPWNCDVPVPMAIVQGQVYCNNTETVSDIIIRVGQSEVMTDNEGRYRCRVRADDVNAISIDANRNDGIGTIAPISVGPLSQNQVLVQDVMVNACPAHFIGTLVDCNDEPTEGLAEIIGPNGYRYALIGRDGNFDIRVKSNSVLEVIFHGFSSGSGSSESITIESLPQGSRDLGRVTACNGETAIPYTEIDPPLSAVLLAFSPDGSMVVGAGGGILHIYDVNASTESLIHQMPLPEPAYTEFNRNSTRLMTSSLEGLVQIWNTSTWNKEKEISLPDMMNGSGVLFHPDGESVIYTQKIIEGGIEQHRIVQYTIATDAVTELFRLSENTSSSRIYKLLGLRNNGEQVVCAVEKNNPAVPDAVMLNLVVWDSQNGILSDNAIIQKTGMVPYMMQLSANGNRLLVYRSNMMQIFYTDTGAEISKYTSQESLFGKPAEYEPIVLSPDGASFVASFANNKQKPFGIYSAETGTLIKALAVPAASDSYVDVIRFSADGKKIGGRTLGNQRQRIWHLP